MRTTWLAMILAGLGTAALVSPPAQAMRIREAAESLLPKLGEKQPPGEVLFAEDFETGTMDRWRADQGWSVVDLPDGGKCARVVSSEDFEDLIVKDHIPIVPGRLIAAYWRARLVSGQEPLCLRVDFFGGDGKTGDPYARQEPSRETGEWTENAMLISDWFPGYTRAITIHFHQGPKTNTSAMLDDIRVVDLTSAVTEMVMEERPRWVAAAEGVAAEAVALPRSAMTDAWKPAIAAAARKAEAALQACMAFEPGTDAEAKALARPAATVKRLGEAVAALKAGTAAAERVLVYRTTPVTSTMVLPFTTDLPGEVASKVSLRACAGECEPASLVLWAPEAVTGLAVTAGNLKGPGGTIPASNVDVKWVKCWFQAGSAPHGISQDRSHKVLVPELLLNDDTLVKVDLEGQHSTLKLSFPEGPKYVPIDDPTNVPWGWRKQLDEFSVRDSDQVLPLDLPAGENKQVWVRVHVPPNAKPGRYEGDITLSADQKKLGQVTLSVEVLPFALEAPKTHHDLTRDFTGSLYYWGELDPTGAGTIGFKVKSEEQLRAELRHMYEHGIVAPMMIWSPEIVYGNEPLFRKMLGIMRDTGMSGRDLHFGDSGMVGAPTEPAALETLRANVAKTIRIARECGFGDVYFYGLDEATGDVLKSERTAWQAVHEAGGKLVVSGYRGQLEAVGDLLDLFNWAGPLDPGQPPEWHKRGHMIWNYANPQTPVEDPAVYRRNYGLLLWKTDYDGACTYCYMDSSGSPWNDFDCDSYRDHNVAYPTVNGIVETLALEGLREGMDDVKYATVLRLAIEKAMKSGTAQAKAKAAEADRWLEGIEPKTADLDATRDEMVRWIGELRR